MAVVLGFIVLLSIFFYREIFLQSVIYCCDNFLINIPSKVFFIEELQQGRFPLWNPYIFSGTQFFADINNALLYPLNGLYAVLSPFRALTWDIIFNVFIVLTGVYVFGRSLKLSVFGSFVAAMVFGFSGTMVVYTNNAPMMQVAALLPWVIWSANRYLSQPNGRTLGVAAGSVSLQILAGHPQLTFYTWLLALCFALWHYGRRSTLLLPLLFLAGLLSAVQLLPFLEFSLHSTRSGRDYAYATFDSLNPLAIARFIIPLVSGDLSRGFAYFFGGSVYGYVGVAALLLAFFAKRKEKVVRFFLISAVFSFLLAIGKYSPVYFLAYHTIPGIASFRSPQHFLLLFTFSVAILAGFGIERLRTLRWFFLGLILVELFTFSRTNLLTVPQRQVAEWLKGAALQASQFGSINRETERILVDQNLFPNPNARGWPFRDTPGETAWQATILRPNLNMLYRISSVDGYAALVPRDYQMVVAPQSVDPTGVDFKNVSPDMLQKLGVRFFLTKGTDGKPEVGELAGWKAQTALRATVPKSVTLGLFLSLIGVVATTIIGLMWKGETKQSKVRLREKGS